MSSLVTLSLVDVVEATPRSRLLVLGTGPAPFVFLAGQAVMAGRHGQDVRRPYSIASPPEQVGTTGRLELLVGVDASGAFGPHLSGIAPGSAVDIEGPIGSFTFPATSGDRPLLFVAGGTGIAPLRSMLGHALSQSRVGPVTVLFSARRSDEFAFSGELENMEHGGRITLHRTITREDDGWAGPRGRISRDHFEAVLHEPARTLCFVCGPPDMVRGALTQLMEMGVPRDAVLAEEWIVRR